MTLANSTATGPQCHWYASDMQKLGRLIWWHRLLKSCQPSYFDYDSFSGAMTNYYLPWLALAAQLPYENGSTWNTFMAFCLSLGSPALIAYSLMITLLNRIWVHDHFAGLIERAKKVADRCKSYGERIEAVLYFLKEAQQAPLRATQVQFQLASLVVLPQNQHWWKSLAERLEHSRRGVTFSLVAQILLAAFVWLFTIISSFAAAFGDSTTALQIAAATLWIWLVGWHPFRMHRSLPFLFLSLFSF